LNIALEIRLRARNCERRSYEQESVRNVVTELDWLKRK